MGESGSVGHEVKNKNKKKKKGGKRCGKWNVAAEKSKDGGKFRVF